jgi:hypothetical protein
LSNTGRSFAGSGRVSRSEVVTSPID